METQYLKSLGFSQNEEKVYTALLQHKFLNGYEIAKFSGVSRSLVYGVIDRLVNRGILFQVEGEPCYYRPLEYEKLISRIRREQESDLNRAEEFLSGLSGEEENQDYVLNLVGYDRFIRKALELIGGAKREVSLSVWREEFERLREALAAAIAQGVKVYLFSFEDIDLAGAKVFSYRLRDASGLFPYRRMTLLVDGTVCLTGADSGQRSIFTYTKNHAIVSLATDELVLNIFCHRYVEKQGLLAPGKTSEDFLRMLRGLAGQFGVDWDMTKNLMVYEFQERRMLEPESPLPEERCECDG
ncbi:TrmB family transcriptional regulator [Acetatifactor muris]|nr:TrmB family transcriptional regulator [Acetatifactor muris]MCI8800268.1 TrmB family transcriptional regulator [Lachnospiraceae bacterium]MCR2047437.1 TrmB family transcriptional regulator [Acetatifactor muris]